MIKKIKSNIMIIIVLISLLIFLVAGIYQFNINNVSYDTKVVASGTEIVESSVNQVIQGIKPESNGLSKIAIEFNLIPENQWNNTILKVTLSDEKTGEKIVTDEIEYIDLKFNQIHILEFDPITNSEDANYSLEIIIDSEKQASILPKFAKSDTSNFTVDNTEVNGQLALVEYYYNNNNFLIFLISTIIIFVTILIVANYILKAKNTPIHKLFLITAVPIYFFFIALIPMFAGHDEFYHWIRAYEVSEGHLVSGIQDGQILTELHGAAGDIFSGVGNIYYHSTIDKFAIYEDANYTVNFDTRTVALYSPVQYLPQTLGIKIADIFTDSTMFMAYAGRIVNTIVSLILIYFAIKIIPIGKKIVALVSLFPIAMEGFTTLSPDALTFSISLFLIAYILNLCFKNDKYKIERKDYIILMVSSIVLSLCKIVYFPIVFLVLLIPQEIFETKKQRWKFILSILISSMLANIIWLGISSMYLAMYDSSLGQTATIFTNLFEYISLVIHTFMLNFSRYTMTMIGSELTWIELVKVYPFVIYMFLILLTVATLAKGKDKKKLTHRHYIVYSIIALAVVGLIFTSLYIQWTPIGSTVIQGIQGRYFLPVLPLILLLFSKVELNVGTKTNLDKIILVSSLVLNFSVLLSILIQYI